MLTRAVSRLAFFAVAGLFGVAMVTPAAFAGVISGLYDTGTTGWRVSGGSCPTGTGTCTAGTSFLNSPVYIPTDAALVDPINNDVFWNVTGLGAGDTSQWIVPAVRRDGTVKYPENTPIGGDMDFGLALYEFAITFQISDASHVVGISGNYWVDGKLGVDGPQAQGLITSNTTGLCGIQLNQTCFDSFFIAPTASYASAGNPFLINSGFVTGDNTLIFRSVNSNREVGLRVDLTPSETPEPATAGLIAAGLLGLAIARRRITAS